MAETRSELKRRRWADVLVIIVGVYEVMLSLFGSVLARPGGVEPRVSAAGWFFAATGMAGALAIAAVVLALRSTFLARVLAAVAGVILLAALFVVEKFGARAVLNLILPAVLLFAATPFLGPMPTPEEEGKRR